ncbi:MAG: hypothetical protein KQI35_05950 [Bacteroidetes bacterium]|nr:hypothetical protein [Bacteroidota bacterium]
MQTATIALIKSELNNRSNKELINIILRLARFKKDNKELLTYLLFDSIDEQAYISEVCKEIDVAFTQINTSHLYFAKKSIRKILRRTQAVIRYSGQKQTEVELLIHFCKALKNSGIQFSQNTALNNLYLRQLQKIKNAIKSLHEDLQYDYNMELEEL